MAISDTITRFKCPVCGKLTTGRKPKSGQAMGDGTVYYPRRHLWKGHACPGNNQAAIWVEIPIPFTRREIQLLTHIDTLTETIDQALDWLVTRRDDPACRQNAATVLALGLAQVWEGKRAALENILTGTDDDD